MKFKIRKGRKFPLQFALPVLVSKELNFIIKTPQNLPDPASIGEICLMQFFTIGLSKRMSLLLAQRNTGVYLYMKDHYKYLIGEWHVETYYTLKIVRISPSSVSITVDPLIKYGNTMEYKLLTPSHKAIWVIAWPHMLANYRMTSDVVIEIKKV
ncbi:MAG: hypothetical protein HPY80_00345 [Bacteroidales bacterium]|nr:hypothetical protein [Bacteroidales bacterium]